MNLKIKLYTLSTCIHCKNAKKFLNECKADYTFTDVDLLNEKNKEEIIKEIEKINPHLSFPTIIIDDKVIIGFNPEEIKEALGLT